MENVDKLLASLISDVRNIPITVVNDLNEISFGEWEGKIQEDIESEDYANFWFFPHKYDHRPHKAEGLLDFKKRVERTIKEIIENNSTGNILIVTHGVVIKAMMAFFGDIPTEKLWDPPVMHDTSLSIVTWDGERFIKKKLGDTSHMEICSLVEE